MDWSISPQGSRYRELVFDEWWTDADLITAEDGIMEFDVFAGDYQITVDGINHAVDISAGYKPLNVAINNNILSVSSDPEIKLRLPVSQNIYANNEPIDFELELIGDTGLVDKVEFYVGNSKLKSDTSSPYKLTWLDSITGTNLVWAKVFYVNGSVEYSKTNQISVMSSQIAGENLLPNGGFENFTADWQAMGPGSFSTTNQRKRNGNYSGRASNLSGMVSELQIL